MTEQPQQILCFDLDGVLLDVSEKYYRLYVDLMNELGGRPLPKLEYWSYKRERVSEKVIAERSGLQARYKDYRSLRVERIETVEYLNRDRTWPGIEMMLEGLRRKNLVYLVTLRQSSERLQWQLAQLGLSRLFHRVLRAQPEAGAENRGHLKAELVRKALGEGRSRPGWFVGDTETDLEAGRLLDLRTAAVTFGIRSERLLDRLSPDVILRTSNELVDWSSNFQTGKATL
ncbi:MAG: HAD hydrolase-like protein [Actinobacteria bacterium]|nr:HAD hydrolase-like protein [Actinomycetota bacterium]